jgi:ABC-type multidrug transport system fused ATPase/permease subunit
MEPHPIRMVVGDDLERSRLTVFFRLLLAIPHIIWLFLWGIAVFFVAILSWFIVLFTARLPDGLHGFSAAYLRYGTHVYGYVLLAANPFPGFTGTEGTYPIDLEIDPPAPQSRWKTAFRIILVFPALFITAALVQGFSSGGGGGTTASGSEEAYYYSSGSLGLALTIAFFAWFACMVKARMPNGFRDALAYALRYAAQTYGYLIFLTDRYPHADPRQNPVSVPPPPRPIALTADEDLHRSRLTVFFRLLLAIPLIIWLLLWSIPVVVVLIIGWIAAIILGRFPDPFHRFVGAYLRYTIHLFAFLSLVANPFPGFTGTPGTYPVELNIEPPERQSRWTIAFRSVLVFPAIAVESALSGALLIAAFFAWFASMATGRMPAGFRALGEWALGYYGQTYGYLYLLTGTYPYSGPPALLLPEAVEEEQPVDTWPEPPEPPSFSVS